MERVAIYGRVADHRDGMMRQKAQLMQHLSGIIQAHSDWTYSGAYIDTGNSHEQLELLLDNHYTFLEFPYNASENSQPSAERIETGPGKKEGIVNKPP